jgi:hypothetical protein
VQLTPSFSPFHRDFVRVLKDQWGQTILEISTREATIHLPDGSCHKQHLYESVQLVCGAMYEPRMSVGTDPVMLLGVCQTCRHPPFRLFGKETPTHGLCSKAAGHTCVDCGTFVCPRHASNRGECQCRWRCLPCAKRNRTRSLAANLLTRIFFKEE